VQHPDPAQPTGAGEAFFRTLIEGFADVIVVLDDAGTIRYHTPSAATLFGPGPIIGARLPDLVGDDARPDVAWAVDDMLSRDAPEPGTEGIWQITGLDGQPLHVRVHSRDLRGTTTVGGLVLTLRDVTGQHQLEEELQRRAAYDARTGLLKAEKFEERADLAVALAQRGGTTTAVMLVDLDDFKAVNDTLGHLAGDELLAAAAGRLTGAVRDAGTASRYGGDEFAMLLENLPDPAAAVAFADRIVQAFSTPFALAAGQVTIGISVGVATTADSASLRELLTHADLALYAAKDGGGQAWRAYDAATTARMPARRKTRSRAAQVSSLDTPDPRPDVTGRRTPESSAGRRDRTTGSEDRPQITP
jgi:diguanylate cyclase (GGDEF)-like protein/PAS domain S-box-containing protein